ncbi:AmmeMemoRadiSam system protein B [Vibrio sp. HA2012]|uniref:AmmeMemoRadiSam system protein B n=1 Tax=Vibrio sp. HA2012 TaxID=1971595 RepID=UPI000C2BF6E4|nr:AmmeMemoRadiSam system protein B [Vibrio sp. HA2012]PJC87898.1 AmmeMemoRadiSam system protein B [Vibrio sp. HA2012]
MNIRTPAVAGQFYARLPTTLRSQLTQWLACPPEYESPLRAIIVPHAGYMYSGEIAAKAYAHVKLQSDHFHKVILVGPSHHFYFDGCAVPKADVYTTPLGDIRIDKPGIKQLIRHPEVQVTDQLHAPEHSLEVQLPFLQLSLDEFTLLPVLTGNIAPEILAGIIDPLWDESTLLVISSDLSHFHTYMDAMNIDLNSCDLIEDYQPILKPEQACGCTGINTLLVLADKHGYQLERLQLLNSGDTSETKERVVGYVSYIVSTL